MLNKARHEKNPTGDFKFYLLCRSGICRDTGSFISFTCLKIYVVTEDLKVRNYCLQKKTAVW